MPEPDAVPPPPRPPRWRPDRDLVLSLAAVVVSACALGVSLVQTMVVRAQQYAAVWPRLTIVLEVDFRPDSLSLSVRNAGVGPAQVAWAQVTLDGAPVDDWPALVARAAPAGAGRVHTFLSYNSLTGGVLVPGEREVALRLAGDPVRRFYGASTRVGLRVCYWSVCDRCWRLESPSVGAHVPRERVTPVPACPRPATPVV
ncbi:hypothetical protein tb265_44260 [Gemmatimonadetes bacterium T265]|nr:hypothetical protein tb265_44260 [Gemmatimonadetes bacterium T265]